MIIKHQEGEGVSALKKMSEGWGRTSIRILLERAIAEDNLMRTVLGFQLPRKQHRRFPWL